MAKRPQRKSMIVRRQELDDEIETAGRIKDEWEAVRNGNGQVFTETELAVEVARAHWEWDANAAVLVDREWQLVRDHAIVSNRLNAELNFIEGVSTNRNSDLLRTYLRGKDKVLSGLMTELSEVCIRSGRDRSVKVMAGPVGARLVAIQLVVAGKDNGDALRRAIQEHPLARTLELFERAQEIDLGGPRDLACRANVAETLAMLRLQWGGKRRRHEEIVALLDFYESLEMPLKIQIASLVYLQERVFAKPSKLDRHEKNAMKSWYSRLRDDFGHILD